MCSNLVGAKLSLSPSAMTLLMGTMRLIDSSPSRSPARFLKYPQDSSFKRKVIGYFGAAFLRPTIPTSMHSSIPDANVLKWPFDGETPPSSPARAQYCRPGRSRRDPALKGVTAPVPICLLLVPLPLLMKQSLAACPKTSANRPRCSDGLGTPSRQFVSTA